MPKLQLLSPHTADRSTILAGVLWTCLLLCVLAIGFSGKYQWDFRIFHIAPNALLTGSNPYAVHNSELGYPGGLSYLYPPLILYVLKPLSLLPYHAASLVWFILKLLALVGLIIIWHSHFEPVAKSWLAILFLTFAFNAPIMRDLTAGNISIFEELGLWLGFLLLLGNRPYLAGLTLAFTAQLKLMPIAFIGLLLLLGPRPRWAPFAIAITAFVTLLALNFLLLPDMARQFIDLFSSTHHPNLDERGAINPSSLAFIRDVAEAAARGGLPIGRSTADLAYVLYVGASAMTLLGVAWRYPKLIRDNPRWLIYVACVVFVLIMPRVKDYTYIIVLIPGVFVLGKVLDGSVRGLSLIPLIVVLAIPHLQFGYIGRGLTTWLDSYKAWLLAWCLLYYLVQLRFEELRLQGAPADTDRRNG